ncbi:MAG: sulfite exporter TauE/SafE family protein [Bacteroidota bacterium]
MSMGDILGYFVAVVIGFTLGLIGGGGSILTVPALVYILGVNPVLSTAYSLFIVGMSALAGAFTYMRKGLLHYRTAFVFAVPSFVAVYLTRKLLVPAIPNEIARWGDLILTKDMAVMVFFAIIMLFASISMIKKNNGSKYDGKSNEAQFNYPMIFFEGVVVGALTGLIGAGGGFLIIPALVLLAKLPMKMAVGTSLLIISAKSLIGFMGDIGNQPIDWSFLFGFTLFAIVGIVIGSYTSKYFSALKLKKAFGWFVLVMAIYIILKELLIN